MDWDWVIPLVTLSAMEIVLGVDNVIFIAILAGKLPPERQNAARQIGLMVALGTRLLLLLGLYTVIGLTYALFSLSDLGIPRAWLSADADAVSWKDIILFAGGTFLIAKSTWEIHEKLEGGEHHATAARGVGFTSVIVQIAILDIVFSLDSVITAVGMARQIWVMVVAMFIAVGVMLFFAGPISTFVARHPTMKMLALSFLILIGVLLVAESLAQHLDRGYIYFAMAFSFVVELLNLRLRAKAAPVVLREPPPVGR